MEKKLSESARQKRKEYQRQYRKRKTEKMCKHSKDYLERKAGKNLQELFYQFNWIDPAK